MGKSCVFAEVRDRSVAPLLFPPNIPYYTKSNKVFVEVALIVVDAIGRTTMIRIEVPGASPQWRKVFVSSFPSTSVCRGSFIVVM